MGEEPPSVDLAVLESLRELQGPDDPNFFAELVEQFVKHADHAIPGIRAAVASGDSHEVEFLAHALKGSSGNMGAMRMHGFCAALQKVGASKFLHGTATTSGAAPSVVEALAAEYAAVRARLLKEADARPAPRPGSGQAPPTGLR